MPLHSQKQHAQNCMAYIAAYAFVGIMNGLVYDVLLTYLQSVFPAIAKGMASYMGVATFAAAAAAISAPKLGYRRVMTAAAIGMAAALLLISSSRSQWAVSLGLLILITGTTLFDVMLPPFIAAYTTAGGRTAAFTKASFAGMLGLALGTSVGGPLIVWIFSKKLDMVYLKAKLLTQSISRLNPEQYACYIGSYRIVIMTFAVLPILMLIPLLFIKESRKDFSEDAKVDITRRSGPSELINRYVAVFLVYSVLGRFAAALIVPQVSVYLTKLGLDRAAVSFIGTLQYLAILGFMLFSARLVQKIGQVYAVVALTLSSVPFMLVLANGNRYESRIGLIVGVALFFRAGLANAAIPAVNSLTMELVPKNSRSLYASLVFIVQSLAQVLAGLFTKLYLFNKDSGYADAYYYAAALYVIAHGLLLLFFSKRHSRTPRPYYTDAMENSRAESQ